MSLTSKVGVCWLIVPGPGWGGPAEMTLTHMSLSLLLGPRRLTWACCSSRTLRVSHWANACHALDYIPPSNIQLEKTAIWAPQHQGAEKHPRRAELGSEGR